MNQSLAQWVAAKGGIKISHHEMRGEISRVRGLNKYLRGKRSVVSPTGQDFDRMALWAIEQGFPVTEGTFLDELERDAVALSRGELRNRVFVDYEIQDSDLAYFEGTEANDPDSCCGVCGAYCEDGTCETCTDWAVDIFREFIVRRSRQRAAESFFETMRGVA